MSRYTRADVARRQRLARRGLLAVLAVALVTLAVVMLIAGAGSGGAERSAAQRFVALWADGDYAPMYRLLDDRARRGVSEAAFAADYRAASATATVSEIDVGSAGDRSHGAIPVAVTVRTRVFGTLHATLEVPLSGSGEGTRVAWRPRLVFPGLRAGEQLTRSTVLPPRATLLARDGTVLAAGAARTTNAPDIAGEIVGRLAAAPPEQAAELRALGYPAGALVGASGLERAFQPQLAGHPGGTLVAGARVLARTAPHAGGPVRTTIDPTVERAAIAALGGRYGGIVAMAPATGELLALAGVAYSALQPPGSTFKIVTLTGVLESRLAKPASSYPVLDGAAIEGVTIQNANGEYCGGTLVQAFANSCNSVFAPLGARLGARRLVDVAERYGFNDPPAIPGSQASTIPSASAIGDALAVGSSAIGQGLVQATALQMTTVAATIANGGLRPRPTLALGARAPRIRVTRTRVAQQVTRMMRAVVQYGTGTAAAIQGAKVAGKTGTAELRDTVPPPNATPTGQAAQQPQGSRPDTDAWFVAFAPERHPRIAVGALFVEAGAGGDVAAPAARGVLLAGLQRHGR